MNRLEKLQSALDVLKTERAQITQNWYLQNCWVTQSKPGGTARTNHKYWQARSREPIFDGKTVKHLRADEVEDYKAAIARGRRLKQIDRQIETLQQQLAKLISTPDSSTESSGGVSASSSAVQEHSSPIPVLSTGNRSQQMQGTSPTGVKSIDLQEQDRVVKEVLNHSRALRTALRQSIDRGKKLGVRNIDLRMEQSYLQ